MFLKFRSSPTGTLLVVQSIFDIGFSPPGVVANFLCNQFMPNFVRDLRKAVRLVRDGEDDTWRNRLQQDASGFYNTLRQAEKVAKLRAEVNAFKLPGREIVHRLSPLSDLFKSP